MFYDILGSYVDSLSQKYLLFVLQPCEYDLKISAHFKKGFVGYCISEPVPRLQRFKDM